MIATSQQDPVLDPHRVRRRVVITGLGAVTPVGHDATSTWAALLAGRSGVGPIKTFDPTTYPVRIAGMVEGLDVAGKLPNRTIGRHLSRAGGFGAVATSEAIGDAAPADNHPADRRGVAMAGHIDRPPLEELVQIVTVPRDSGGTRIYRRAPGDVMLQSQNTPLSVMAQLAGSRGPTISINTACAASAHSIGDAYRRIQDDEADLMVAGGYDALTTYLDVLGFALLGALTTEYNDAPTHASRPFDKGRSGFVLGEGGVAAVLEERSAALARGAHIYAEIVGYGSSMNAYRITDSPPDGGGAIDAIQAALDDAGVGPKEIDYVVAHGTGTAGNDVSETRALKTVFGDHAERLAISSPKSMTGHLTAAAGALSVLVAALAIRDGIVPPTINLDEPDPKLDLDYVPNEARRMAVRTVLVNTFAFGGTNACLVVRALR